MTIHFKAVYDGQPLQTFTTHPFENGQQIEFTHLSMFVADLALTHQSSLEVLDDIELIDLSFENLASAEEGYTLELTGVPARTYDGITFGIGVPPDLNEKVPADFPSSNPLSKTSYYWVGWSSYIFQKTEGKLDTLGNSDPDLSFAIHTGSDALYTTLEGDPAITIQDGKNTNIDIVIDYKKILQGVDIKASPQNHNPNDIATITILVNNLPNAFSLFQ